MMDAQEDGYPLYCISVPTFLELEQWMPHQDAVKAGKVVKYDAATMSGKVLFISQ